MKFKFSCTLEVDSEYFKTLMFEKGFDRAMEDAIIGANNRLRDDGCDQLDGMVYIPGLARCNQCNGSETMLVNMEEEMEVDELQKYNYQPGVVSQCIGCGVFTRITKDEFQQLIS